MITIMMKVMIISKIKEWITKIIKVLLTRVVIKTIIIEIIKILITTIMIITVIIIINNSNFKILWKWCKVGNTEMQYGMCKKKLKKLKC